MASKGLLSFTNLIDADGTVLSASSEAANLGVANLADPIVQKPWRSLDADGWCQVDLGSDQTIGVVAFQIPRSGVMVGSTDTVRLQLDASGGTAGSGAVYDSTALASGIVSTFGTWLHFFAAPVSARYVRLTFATSLSYFQIGRLWVGPYLQPSRNFAYGWGREWDDLSQISKAPKSGIRIRNTASKFRTLTVAWNSLTSSDADSVEDGDIATGISSQMLVCTHPDDPMRKTIIGTPSRPSPVVQANFVQYQKAYTVEEDL